VSYWETTAVLFALANEAVPGLPAYTTPACPLPLNGEPGAAADEPGVTGLAGPHVFAGAPGWPVVGLTVAHAEAGAAASKPAEQASTRTYFRICSSWVVRAGCPFAAGCMRRGRRFVHATRLALVHTKASCKAADQWHGFAAGIPRVRGPGSFGDFRSITPGTPITLGQARRQIGEAR
jgi:hypothetical protein